MSSNQTDDAVQKMNYFLEGVLESACGWFTQQVEKAREKKEQAKQTEETTEEKSHD